MSKLMIELFIIISICVFVILVIFYITPVNYKILKFDNQKYISNSYHVIMSNNVLNYENTLKTHNLIRIICKTMETIPVYINNYIKSDKIYISKNMIINTFNNDIIISNESNKAILIEIQVF